MKRYKLEWAEDGKSVLCKEDPNGAFTITDVTTLSSTKTADIQEKLNAIEPKSKTCAMWFDELPEGTPKLAVNSARIR